MRSQRQWTQGTELHSEHRDDKQPQEGRSLVSDDITVTMTRQSYEAILPWGLKLGETMLLQGYAKGSIAKGNEGVRACVGKVLLRANGAAVHSPQDLDAADVDSTTLRLQFRSKGGAETAEKMLPPHDEQQQEQLVNQIRMTQRVLQVRHVPLDEMPLSFPERGQEGVCNEN